jgi:hypothetical protein
MHLEPVGSTVYIEYDPPINYSDFVTIETSRNGGITWRQVPSLTLVPVSGDSPVGAYDYLAPLNSMSWYRALPFREEDGVLLAAPNYSEWASVEVPGEGWWLK